MTSSDWISSYRRGRLKNKVNVVHPQISHTAAPCLSVITYVNGWYGMKSLRTFSCRTLSDSMSHYQTFFGGWMNYMMFLKWQLGEQRRMVTLLPHAVTEVLRALPPSLTTFSFLGFFFFFDLCAYAYGILL